ncbi:MAG: lytic transglycosylase domain-containing protein [Gemmatimonadales bacterium]|nr:lytic transglycosylase domain-containing protein [Gemmatimonadales bacterium]
MVWSLVIYAAGAGALALVARRGSRPVQHHASVVQVAAACDAGDRAAALAACGCGPVDSGPAVPWERVALAYQRAGDTHAASLPLVLALVGQESDFRPRAVRHEPCVWVADWTATARAAHPRGTDCCAWGSFGLTQVLFAVALDRGGDLVDRPEDLFDPDVSIEVGLRVLDHWLDRFGAGGAGGPWSDVLAGYNSGRRYAAAPKRTQNYVDAVIAKRREWEARLSPGLQPWAA